MINQKCFGYSKSKCLILTKMNCNNCKFAKTEEEIKKNRDKCNMRLRSIPEVTQSYIAGKYYGGVMPWIKGVN